MQNTEKRIAALEAKATTSDDLTIIRRIVTASHPDAELKIISDKVGNIWTRWTDETEDEFTQRATEDTQPNVCGVKSLIAKNLKPQHAKP